MPQVFEQSLFLFLPRIGWGWGKYLHCRWTFSNLFPSSYFFRGIERRSLSRKKRRTMKRSTLSSFLLLCLFRASQKWPQKEPPPPQPLFLFFWCLRPIAGVVVARKRSRHRHKKKKNKNRVKKNAKITPIHLYSFTLGCHKIYIC